LLGDGGLLPIAQISGGGAILLVPARASVEKYDEIGDKPAYRGFQHLQELGIGEVFIWTFRTIKMRVYLGMSVSGLLTRATVVERIFTAADREFIE
jgi:hypothetical protein